MGAACVPGLGIALLAGIGWWMFRLVRETRGIYREGRYFDAVFKVVLAVFLFVPALIVFELIGFIIFWRS